MARLRQAQLLANHDYHVKYGPAKPSLALVSSRIFLYTEGVTGSSPPKVQHRAQLPASRVDPEPGVSTLGVCRGLRAYKDGALDEGVAGKPRNRAGRAATDHPD